MEDIAIYGAGGFGRETACLIRIINEHEPQWNFIGFFDDGKRVGDRNEYGEVLGGMNELNGWSKPLNVVLAIGTPETVVHLAESITNPLVAFPNIIHPNLGIADANNYHIGKGNIICAGCWFSCNVVIGDFNVMNGSVVFGHDDTIGSFNTFMPTVRVSGEVVVGNENFFGVGSIILQRMRVGSNVRLGAGSVLMTRPRDGQLYIGNPAKLFRY